jgi:toxin ParE1/3/4
VPFQVVLTDLATRDLDELVDHIARHDSPPAADHVLDRIAGTLGSLAEHPDRGVRPRELVELGIREYREVFFKPYRIIYRVIEDRVVVMLIVDGRRSLQELLRRRLLDH